MSQRFLFCFVLSDVTLPGSNSISYVLYLISIRLCLYRETGVVFLIRIASAESHCSVI